MQKYLSILRNSPFFKGLTDNEILSILHCVNATTISKKRDSYIFRAGDITEVMGIVVSGCVLIIQEDIWGHRNILSKCHAGDFFGEPYAASQRAVLNISVVADEDCEIILLNVKRLLISKQYNIDLMDVIKNFGEKGKIMIGHCAAAMLFDFTGITEGKTLAVHPLAKPAISKGQTTDEDSVVDGNFFTAKEEHYICTMMPQVLEALKK